MKKVSSSPIEFTDCTALTLEVHMPGHMKKFKINNPPKFINIDYMTGSDDRITWEKLDYERVG